MPDEQAQQKALAKALMARVRKTGLLPSSKEIVSEACRQLDYVKGRTPPEEVLANFNGMLRRVFIDALPILEVHEERSYAGGIARELMEEHPTLLKEAESVAEREGFRAGVTVLMKAWYPHMRLCFLSISQSRKTRGGKDFELQIEALLDLADLPYHKQERKHRTDLILPSLELFEKVPAKAALVSVKRTLRERWREVAEELHALRAPNVFLFTADEDVTTSVARGICSHNIYLVVWDHVKAGKLTDEARVLGYTSWGADHISVLRKFWPDRAT